MAAGIPFGCSSWDELHAARRESDEARRQKRREALRKEFGPGFCALENESPADCVYKSVCGEIVDIAYNHGCTDSMGDEFSYGPSVCIKLYRLNKANGTARTESIHSDLFQTAMFSGSESFLTAKMLERMKEEASLRQEWFPKVFSQAFDAKPEESGTQKIA